MIEVIRLELFEAIREAGKPGAPKLLLPTADLPVHVQTYGRDGVKLVALGRAPGRGTVRVSYDHLGDHPGKAMLLGDVLGTKYHETGATEMWIKHKAAWSPRKDCLVEFLTMRLQHDNLPEAGLSQQQHGWGYVFPKRSASVEESGPVLVPPPPPADPPAPGPENQRREKRVTVRVPCRYDVDGTRYDGMVYNVSSGGLFVLTDAAIPWKGRVVDVFFSPLSQRDGSASRLTGVVCWVVDGMSGSNGFGIQLAEILDGAKGANWAVWVESQTKLSGDEVEWT
ncbi:MAG: hypothetical protein ACI9WU_002108 [Myxococcota bacterium]|jgi:hypothetical protein